MTTAEWPAMRTSGPAELRHGAGHEYVVFRSGREECGGLLTHLAYGRDAQYVDHWLTVEAVS